MFERLGIFISLFRKGNEVADVEKWKKHQMTATIVAPFLAALLMLAKSYGYDIPLNNEDLLQLAGGVVVVVNLVLTMATSKRAGILPAKPSAPAAQVPTPASDPAPAPAAQSAPDAPVPDPVAQPPVQPVSQTDPRKDTYFG